MTFRGFASRSGHEEESTIFGFPLPVEERRDGNTEAAEIGAQRREKANTQADSVQGVTVDQSAKAGLSPTKIASSG